MSLNAQTSIIRILPALILACDLKKKTTTQNDCLKSSIYISVRPGQGWREWGSSIEWKNINAFGFPFPDFEGVFFPLFLYWAILKILTFMSGVSSEGEGSRTCLPFVSLTSRNSGVSICWIREPPAFLPFSNSCIQGNTFKSQVPGSVLLCWGPIRKKFSRSYICKNLPFSHVFHASGDLLRKSAFSYCGGLAGLPLS